MNMKRAYYAILYSQTAINLGFSLYTMAVILFLFTKTGSTAMASLMTFVSIVCRVLGSAVLPLVTGRFTLRSLLIGSQLIQITLLVCLFFVIQTGSSAFFFLMFCLIGGISFCNGWFAPIKSALIGEIIPPDRRAKANGLLSAADQTVQFAGWSLGGVIIAFLGESDTMIITVMYWFLRFWASFCFFKYACVRRQQSGNVPFLQMRQAAGCIYFGKSS